MHTKEKITVEESTSDNFGEPQAKVIHLRSPGASMDFVIKKGNHCSVSLASGTIRGMEEMTKCFIDRYSPNTLVNQVSNLSELQAMYKSGLYIHTDNPRPATYRECLEAFKEFPSILVAWKGKVTW
jgi:hypothetical protein